MRMRIQSDRETPPRQGSLKTLVHAKRNYNWNWKRSLRLRLLARPTSEVCLEFRPGKAKAHNLKDETDLPRDGGLEGWRAGAPA